MDTASPPADAPEAPPLPPPTESPAPPEGILGGVAALIGERLGIDPLWIRIAFVLLALVGGVGLFVYGALWLVLIVGSRPGRRWARVVGGALLVLGLPFVLTLRLSFFDGPMAIIILLAGLALALWQPRRPQVAVEPGFTVTSAAVSSPPPVRPPSILGRATLGLAVLVAAGGALIDQANGGRLHPEQWLGAGAIVCGIGLLIGTVVGRARWLAVPAVLFAGSGFVAGEAAKVGVQPGTLAGTRQVFVDGGQPGGWTQREDVVFGSVEVSISGAPTTPVTIDARVAFGEVRVWAADDVTVEVRAAVDHGDVDVNNADRPAGTFTVGPAGPADVVVMAHVGRGHVHVEPYVEARAVKTISTKTISISDPRTVVADGVLLTRTGDVILGDGETILGPDNSVLTGTSTQQGRVLVLPTSLGDFRLLPDGLLVTPYGAVVDLRAVRGQQPSAPPAAPSVPVPATAVP